MTHAKHSALLKYIVADIGTSGCHLYAYSAVCRERIRMPVMNVDPFMQNIIKAGCCMSGRPAGAWFDKLATILISNYAMPEHLKMNHADFIAGRGSPSERFETFWQLESHHDEQLYGLFPDGHSLRRVCIAETLQHCKLRSIDLLYEALPWIWRPRSGRSAVLRLLWDS